MFVNTLCGSMLSILRKTAFPKYDHISYMLFFFFYMLFLKHDVNILHQEVHFLFLEPMWTFSCLDQNNTVEKMLCDF